MSRARLWPCLLLGGFAACGCAARGGGEAELRSSGLWLGPIQLCEASVESASATADPAAGEPALLLTLKPRAARQLARVTARNVNRPLPIRLDGRVLSEPIIRETLTGGQALVTGAGPAAAAAATGAC